MGVVKQGWWRRNAVGLVALAILVPTTLVGIGYQEWSVYYVGRYWQPVPVQPGETVEIHGASFGPATIARAPIEAGIEEPPGTQALAVQVTLTPGDGPLDCLPPTLVDLSTGDEWNRTYAPMGWEGEQSCYEQATPITLHIPYLVPVDAGPFAVDVEFLHDGPEVPRLILDGP